MQMNWKNNWRDQENIPNRPMNQLPQWLEPWATSFNKCQLTEKIDLIEKAWFWG